MSIDRPKIELPRAVPLYPALDLRAALLTALGNPADPVAEVGRLKARAALVPEVEAEWEGGPVMFTRSYLGHRDGHTAISVVGRDGTGWFWRVAHPSDSSTLADNGMADSRATGLPTRDEAIAAAESAACRLGVL